MFIAFHSGCHCTVQVKAQLKTSYANLYDIGLFGAKDGSALTGSICYRNTLTPIATCTNSNYSRASGLGPFYDGESGECDTTDCGDIKKYDLTAKYLLPVQNLSPSQVPVPIEIICRDREHNGQADLSTCLTWDYQTGTDSGDCRNVTLLDSSDECRCQVVNLPQTCVDDGNPCTDDYLDCGQCVHRPKAAGTACGGAPSGAGDAQNTCDASGMRREVQASHYRKLKQSSTWPHFAKWDTAW